MNHIKSKLRNKIQGITIQVKLITVFTLTSLIIMIVNIFMYFNINIMVNQLEQVYISNIKLNELSDTLGDVQAGMTDYLNTKTSDSIEDYYRYEQNYATLVNSLNGNVTSNPLGMMERNIKEMSQKYLTITNQAIEAKRGRNVEKYKLRYENAVELYDYINMYIYSLNNELFRNNSSNYEALSKSLQYLETISTVIMFMIALSSLVLITIVTKTITNPLKY